MIKYMWFPLFLTAAAIEWSAGPTLCGSQYITGQMWVMWLAMALMSLSPYIKKVSK